MTARRHLTLATAPADALTTNAIDRVRESLAERYQVEGEIGHGGMGRVYLARDLRHQRQVAIKVLHSEIASELGSDRFLREIAIAASFLHPSILPLYDSGCVKGLLFYVMPYVDGESLRARLDLEGQLRVEDAMRIVEDVAAALDYAHGRGVLHRDVKPENILLASGRALLADFGLAMTLGDGAPRRRTHSGYVIGTPAYMSPEQAAPGGQLDRRSDIYALGCVVYEMLGGEPPFAGATDRAILARHSVDAVPPLRTVRPGIPEPLEQAVLTALAKVPADRPSEAGKFAASLIAAPTAPGSRPRRRARAVVRFLPLLGLLLAAALPFALEPWPDSGGGRATALPSVRPVLSVGTFANRTGDPTLDPFGALAASWLTWGLARSDAVEVVDSATLGDRAPAARGRPTGTRPATAHLPALLVTGGYYRSGKDIELHATVIDVRSGQVIFAAAPVSTDRANPGTALAHLRDQLLSGIAGTAGAQRRR